MREIKRLAVLGAGLMGQQIAMQSALSGFSTNLYDIDESNAEVRSLYLGA